MLQLSALLLYLSTVISMCAWQHAGAGPVVNAVHLALIVLCIVLWVAGEQPDDTGR